MLGVILAFLCSFAIAGCNDDNDVDYPDTKLIKGQWQLVIPYGNLGSDVVPITTDDGEEPVNLYASASLPIPSKLITTNQNNQTS